MTTTTSIAVKFVLRLPPNVHQRVKKVAKKNHLSMNVLIVRMLEEGLSIESRDDSAKLDKIIEMLEQWD